MQFGSLFEWILVYLLGLFLGFSDHGSPPIRMDTQAWRWFDKLLTICIELERPCVVLVVLMLILGDRLQQIQRANVQYA